MSLFRERSALVDAFLWTADENQTEDPEWMIEALKLGCGVIYGAAIHKSVPFGCCMSITVPSGTSVAVPGDYIVRGTKGEIFAMKPDAFNTRYEAAA